VKTADLCQEHGISAATFYQWKQKFGGMDVSEAQRLRALEEENRWLKMLVAELSLGGEALKSVIRNNGWSLPGLIEDVKHVSVEYWLSERGLQAAGRGAVELSLCTSRRMIGWAEDWKVRLVHIQPGRPM
jgi:putative transposase